MANINNPQATVSKPDDGTSLACGLPYSELQQLRDNTPLVRVNVTEAIEIFDRLHDDGFKIVPAV